jgi:hypothetical protein
MISNKKQKNKSQKKNNNNNQRVYKNNKVNQSNNKENIKSKNPKAMLFPKKIETSFLNSPQISQDSLFIDSENEISNNHFGNSDDKLFQFKNFFKKYMPRENKYSKCSSDESDKNTIFNKPSPKKSSEEYLKNTKNFVKNCFHSISNSNGKNESFALSVNPGLKIPNTKHKGSTLNPNDQQIPSLLRQYNTLVKKNHKKISKKQKKKRLTQSITSFIQNNPLYREALLKFFRQSVESLPILLHIFKTETKPNLRQIQQNVTLNQLTNFPKRNYQEKSIKSTTQLLCFKYYFCKMKRNPSYRDKYIEKLKNLTKNSQRQIYKWIWDEEKRYRESLKVFSIGEVEAKEKALFRSWKEFKAEFQSKVLRKKLWILDRIVVGQNDLFSEKVYRKICGVKLKGLMQKSIFMDLCYSKL